MSPKPNIPSTCRRRPPNPWRRASRTRGETRRRGGGGQASVCRRRTAVRTAADRLMRRGRSAPSATDGWRHHQDRRWYHRCLEASGRPDWPRGGAKGRGPDSASAHVARRDGIRLFRRTLCRRRAGAAAAPTRNKGRYTKLTTQSLVLLFHSDHNLLWLSCGFLQMHVSGA